MSALQPVGNAYATADLRYRVQRHSGSKRWFLYDMQEGERILLGNMRTNAIAVAEWAIKHRETLRDTTD